MAKASRGPSSFPPELETEIERSLYAASVSSAEMSPSPTKKIEHLLRYIEACPTGHHNRDVAERIEASLKLLERHERAKYQARYRRARDPYMPPVERAAKKLLD